MSFRGLWTEATESQVSDRSFGLLMGGFFLLIGLLPLRKGGAIHWWAVGLGTALAVAALARPAVFLQPKRVWLFAGILLGCVVNPIVLGILFYLVITPVGLLARLTGRDALRLQRQPQASTYWRTRSTPPSDMGLQF
jgi:hypothetical protein